MPIPNSDSVPETVFPGISSGVGSSAPGTQGATGPAADNVPGVQVTLPTGSWQDRFTADTGGTLQASQDDDGLAPPAHLSDYFSTGAGEGNPNPYKGRHGGER